MEKTIIKKVGAMLGFDPNSCDGILCPGGTFSNLTAVLTARNEACPTAKEEGLTGAPKLVAFSSPGAHYSVKNAAHVLGIGTENVIQVPSNFDSMIPEELGTLKHISLLVICLLIWLWHTFRETNYRSKRGR